LGERPRLSEGDFFVNIPAGHKLVFGLLAVFGTVSVVGACSQVGQTVDQAPTPIPSASFSSGDFDERASELCRGAEKHTTVPGPLGAAVDGSAGELLEMAAPDFQPAIKDRVGSQSDQYAAVCYFLAVPSASAGPHVLILGVLEDGETLVVNSYE
jgi:hypothetical protein